jgi:GTP1/Obg family GTP-binding protein
MGYNAYGMARTNTVEARLGPDALMQISKDYFGRLKTSSSIAEDHKVRRQAIPRLARAGKLLLAANENGPHPSS